jgi:hypothetical protein
MRLFDIFMGGPGSGNFGHKGIPGQRGGSLPRSGPVRAGYKAREALFNKLEENKAPFDSNGARTGREYAVIVKPDGATIELAGEAEDSSIYISEELEREMKDGDLIHTHPSGNSFSISDVGVAAQTGMRSIQAVGINWEGRKFHYTMTAGKGENRIWPSPTTISMEYEFHSIELRSRNNRKLFKMSLSEREKAVPKLNFTHAHLTWETTAAALGLQYERKEIK